MTAIQDALVKKGYKAFLRPFEMNIVGVRANSSKANTFDDAIYVFFLDRQGSFVQQHFAATTDPGTYWLENPLNPQGTAILKEGQYESAYAIGMHRGVYKALVQQRPVTIIRDYNRNASLDILNGKEEAGLFGINIHHASSVGTTTNVDKYSAGCQVFANVNDFTFFMQLCERHRSLYGNSFTYTLIDERAVSREAKKNS